MAQASLSSGFQSFTPLPTIKLGPSGAGSRVGGLVHTPGPCGSLQRPLLCGWESLLLPPQPSRAFSIRGLRLYFPELEPWVVRSALLPAVCPVYLCANVVPWGATHCSSCPVLCHSESGPLGLSVHQCGAAGAASGQTACAVRPTLRQSQSRHSHTSPLHPGARLRPSYQSGCMFILCFLGVGPPCRSILCQFWLCEEAQCVYLRRRLGSLLFFFISLCIAFTSSFILWPYSVISVSILITAVLNSASDRLAISSSVFFFPELLICSFI